MVPDWSTACKSANVSFRESNSTYTQNTVSDLACSRTRSIYLNSSGVNDFRLVLPLDRFLFAFFQLNTGRNPYLTVSREQPFKTLLSPQVCQPLHFGPDHQSKCPGKAPRWRRSILEVILGYLASVIMRLQTTVNGH
jgi:hypothetical protein